MTFTKDIFIKITRENKIIPAVKNDEWLHSCVGSECGIVYILYGNLCTIADIVETVKKIGKFAIVHVDLVEGLAPKEISVDFIKKYTKADGIISTKASMIKRGSELGLFTIQRFFMTDAFTYANIVKYVKNTDPDVVELLPAGLLKVISYLLNEISKPIIASGLILDAEDVTGALNIGAQAVSTTNRDLW